ncbi:MAG: arginine--tRNA ligase [Candidatus Eisenbacteria bacterium]|nr:arginine--tRNA ligase [Candidatus Eisenbacteria bacterium]
MREMRGWLSEDVADLASILRSHTRAAALAWEAASAARPSLEASRAALAPTRPPRPELGDLAIPCFPLAKPLGKPPAQIASQFLEPLAAEFSRAAADGALPAIASLDTAGPYVNVTFESGSLAGWVLERVAAGAAPYGRSLPSAGRRTMVEYSAPNTNKPLHLGHVRNNLLGLSLCNILAAVGEEVIPVNLVNDRGIHIAKSMVAYERWGEGATPEQANGKGDHFVGHFYVRFSQEVKEQAAAIARARGIDPAALDEEAARAIEDETDLMRAARESLRRWEEDDPETRRLWRTMNGWVYAGFDETYARLGCAFRKWYFESGTYQKGKELVEQGVARGLFARKEDGSVWADLSEEGLGEKLLLRSDGTSVYITQDLGTALIKYDDFHMDRSIYVVGSEQNHHFRLLFALLRKLGLPWADACRHLSYGLVTLPHGMGKLKSREGRAVDADDLLDELAALASNKARAGGFASGDEREVARLGDAIGQGALKLYLLQVSAEKNIQFDPDSTLDFEGDTGPAVQYSHARICSIARKAIAAGKIAIEDLVAVNLPDPFAELGTGSPVHARKTVEASPEDASRADARAAEAVRRAGGLRPERRQPELLTSVFEKALCLELARFPGALALAAEQLSAAPVANYLLDLTKSYARFYHNNPVLQADTEDIMRARLHLSLAVAATLRRGLSLLGIQAPDAM